MEQPRKQSAGTMLVGAKVIAVLDRQFRMGHKAAEANEPVVQLCEKCRKGGVFQQCINLISLASISSEALVKANTKADPFTIKRLVAEELNFEHSTVVI
ncbi:hypothetical protein KIN20_036435 [Parelaphostrongylus tenuis]|uniref:Uncharacterized protein n=1 Tax=Parelaphostrongylus tenuis TaxID=148309 RepID=A0AAD5RDG7_PARTN|nr:hypothetical protein KIN20_036435 [Parelaphostrongylus tenuis]